MAALRRCRRDEHAAQHQRLFAEVRHLQVVKHRSDAAADASRARRRESDSGPARAVSRGLTRRPPVLTRVNDSGRSVRLNCDRVDRCALPSWSMPKNDSSMVFVASPPLSGGVKGSVAPSNSMASATDASFCVFLNGAACTVRVSPLCCSGAFERVAQLGRRIVHGAAPRVARPPRLFVALPFCRRSPARRCISAARRDAQPGPLHADLDAMEAAVARRRGRVVAQHVVPAVRVDDAAERRAERVLC